MFHLKREDHLGRIYLKDGQIVHAVLDEIKGEEAVYELAIWNDGEFNFEPDVEPDTKSINKSNTNLLMEAARRLDEWRVLSRKIPSLDLIPEFVSDQGQERGQIQLNTSEWLILAKINGKSDVRTIAKACNLPVFDVCKVLYGLVTHRLVALKTPPAHPQPETTADKAAVQEQTSPSKENLLLLLDKIRNICNSTLGKQGEALVDKEYEKARMDIERGLGMGAIQQAVTQIARASSVIKGPSTTELLLDQLKTLKL